MNRPKRGQNKTVGIGWVGRWFDGSIGWSMPEHVSDQSRNRPRKDFISPEQEFVRCRITVEVLPDKRGRIIRRRYDKL